MAVHYSSERHDWRTPEEVLDLVREVDRIALDPCASREGSIDPDVEFFEDDDGLRKQWRDAVMRPRRKGLVYVNPPYGRSLSRWVHKCASEATADVDIIALMPARTDTRWFPWDAQAICFWRGRMRFVGADAPAPFPSALACWSRSRRFVGAFADAFGERGMIVYPGGAA